MSQFDRNNWVNWPVASHLRQPPAAETAQFRAGLLTSAYRSVAADESRALTVIDTALLATAGRVRCEYGRRQYAAGGKCHDHQSLKMKC